MTAATLHVEITAGRALASKDRNGLSDPYCKISLEDENGVKDIDSKRKTEVQKKTLNPEWNSSFSFVLLSKHKTLVIQCWDKDRLKSDFMGEIVIPLSDIGVAPKEGWIELQQKRKAKKQEKITGDLNIAVRLTGNASTDNLKGRQKIANTVNKLFKQSYSALDIFCFLPCHLIESKPKYGTLVAGKHSLYFFTERRAGRRKALEMSWWDIADISKSDDSITVTTGLAMKGKVRTFQDFVEKGNNTVKMIIEAWDEQSRQTKPADKRKSRLSFGSIGKKNGKLKKIRDAAGSTESLDMADISEFTDMSEVSEAYYGSAEGDDEGVDFLKEQVAKTRPIAPGKLPETKKNFSVLPTDADGVIIAHSKNPPTVHFIAKRGVSKHNPGLDSIFIKLVECQNLPEQSYGAPNSFVETHVGSLLYISAIETCDKHPVFSEEYLLEVNKEQDKEIVFSVFHKPKGEDDEFLGEATIKITEIPEENLTTIRKPLSCQPSATRVVQKRGTNHKVLSVGRVQAKTSYDAARKILKLTIVKFQSLNDTSDGIFITVQAGSSSYFTQQKEGEFVDFNESFEFKSVGKDSNLVLCVCKKSSGKPVGMLLFPVNELQRELPKLWLEVPVDTRSDSKRKISINAANEGAGGVSSVMRAGNSRPLQFSSDSFKEDEELNEEPTNSVPTVGKKKDLTSVAVPSKGIDKTYIIAGLGTLFFILALMYTWFF